MLAQLGNIVFEGVNGLESLSRVRASVIPVHPTILSTSKIQKVGDEPISLSITIRFHIAFCIPEDNLQKFEDYRATGEILPFFMGSGDYYGDFVIQSIQDDPINVSRDGGIIETLVSLQLLQHFDTDKDATIRAERLAQAKAIKGANVKPLRVVNPGADTAGASASKEIKDINLSARKVDSLIKETERNPSKSVFNYDKMLTELQKIQSKCASITRTIDNAQELATKVPNLKNVVLSLSNAAGTFQNTFPPSSLADLKASNSSFNTALGNTNKEAQRLNILTSTRKL